jgi:hypothetical protein
MKPILTVSMVFLACAVTLTGRTARTGPPALAAEGLRTVYFSAVDGQGAHVTDLTAAELTVKEGGKDRAIDAVRPATAPMQISLLVDDSGTGGFQAAVGHFIQATFGRAEFAIRVLQPQAIKVQDFTKNGDELRAALGRMGQRGRVQPDNEQVIAGVFDAAKELRQLEARRPSIIVLTATGEKALADTADETLNALKASGASLSVLYITGVELGKVLGDGPRLSGGMIEQVTGSLVQGPALKRIANNLLNQYVLTYTVPDGVKLNERFALSTTRKGVKLLAPTRLPDK